MKHKKYVIWGLLTALGLMLGGCGSKDSATEQTVSLEGRLQAKVEDGYLLMTSGGVQKVDSMKVNLSEYLDQEIKVTGQYSGATLYVDKIDKTPN